MAEKTVEWDLGFALGDVVAGLEKLFAHTDYRVKREKPDAAERFSVPLSQAGSCLLLDVCPLPNRQLGPAIISPRTLLSVHFTKATPEEEADFMKRLTLAFLRVGG
jgi:hypothetical protein